MTKKQPVFNSNKENSIFATRLRELFTEQNKSQKNLADYIKENAQKEYSRQMVSNWTHGCEPNLTTIPIIADFFGVSTDYLLGKSDVKTKDADLAGVCEYTNLSEKAISNICNIAKSGKNLNVLLEYSDLPEIIEMLFAIEEVACIKHYNNTMQKALDKVLKSSGIREAPLGCDAVNEEKTTYSCSTKGEYIQELFKCALIDCTSSHFNASANLLNSKEFHEIEVFREFAFYREINKLIETVKKSETNSEIITENYKAFHNEVRIYFENKKYSIQWIKNISNLDDCDDCQINAISEFLDQFDELLKQCNKLKKEDKQWQQLTDPDTTDTET